MRQAAGCYNRPPGHCWSAPSPVNIPVSELLVRFMERLGVTHIFGMPGAHILPVYDALYHSPIQTVLAKHEQGAAFMAGGQARATGGVGACIATAGPGATNLVTGIANAYVDRLPVLAVTGETSTHIFGRGGLQESSGEGGSIHQAELFRSITRYARLVERTDYLGNVLNRTLHQLRAPRGGPVLLSLPFNVQKELVDDAVLDDLAFGDTPGARSPHHLVQPLANLLVAAKKPVIVAGYGCLRGGAQAQVNRLAELLGAPVATSLKAKGVIDEDAPLALGSLGVTSGDRAYRYIVEQADLVLFLGAGLNERTSYLWDQQLFSGRTLIQVDHDPEQLDKVFRADLSVVAELAPLLDELLAELQARGHRAAATAPSAAPASTQADSRLFPQGLELVESLFDKLQHHFPEGLMVFDDNILYAQNFYRVPARHRYYPNSGISSLGHALPAAIGARMARALPTIAILGDGGFQMCAMELMTAVNYRVPLTVVLFNNGTMGLVRKNQHQHYGDRFIDCDFVNPDYARLAEAFGMVHRRVESPAALDRAFDELDFAGGLNLLEIPVDRDAYPNYDSGRG